MSHSGLRRGGHTTTPHHYAFYILIDHCLRPRRSHRRHDTCSTRFRRFRTRVSRDQEPLRQHHRAHNRCASHLRLLYICRTAANGSVHLIFRPEKRRRQTASTSSRRTCLRAARPVCSTAAAARISRPASSGRTPARRGRSTPRPSSCKRPSRCRCPFFSVGPGLTRAVY
jgi:hypothetical protein